MKASEKKRRIIISIFLVFALVVLVIGCDNKKDRTVDDTVEKSVEKAVPPAGTSKDNTEGSEGETEEPTLTTADVMKNLGMGTVLIKAPEDFRTQIIGTDKIYEEEIKSHPDGVPLEAGVYRVVISKKGFRNGYYDFCLEPGDSWTIPICSPGPVVKKEAPKVASKSTPTKKPCPPEKKVVAELPSAKKPCPECPSGKVIPQPVGYPIAERFGASEVPCENCPSGKTVLAPAPPTLKEKQ